MNDTTTDAASIFSPLWKRKWLILAVAVLVAAGTYEVEKRKPPVYTAATQLYLGVASEQAAAGGGSGGRASKNSLADEAGLINSGIIGEVVRKRLRSEHNRAAALGKAKAKASGQGEFIVITTEARTPRAAVALANAYAKAFINRQDEHYRQSVKTEIANKTDQLRRIELAAVGASKGKGSKRSTSSSTTLQLASLATKINALESSLATFTGAQQVSHAVAAGLPISPKPKSSAIFGFVLGALLAAIAAYALSRVDRRVRSLGDLESIFKDQIVAVLPPVKAPVARPDGRRAPAKALLEPLRRLHTTLELQEALERDLDGGPRTILFLSADAGDGKSTLIANLARVQSEAGERVAIIEADFRRPVQARLLDVNGPYGLADVLAGKIPVGEAMQSVISAAPAANATDSAGPLGGVPAVVEASDAGSVSVLVGGGTVDNPPALLARSQMHEMLRSIADEFDYVLIDAPPPLEVSDVMPLLPIVDGILTVARIGHTRDVSARRLAQLLERTASAPLLGIVANCVPRKDIERFGFAWAPTRPKARRKLKLMG
jgi:Mrp family chromosome partitioning ATPase/capsular polysaccharide biosynthesis protein